ncbi:response regulator transcription factor [Desulfobulbus rhabdoformis]|uniref:response regulator transcription factor n=1 Tax=Desulfobulbus rhabdoformis TaxID=34032 RepID=UPI00196698AE|nr:response regulator transcription factor [Desulfobulbus rhabdoformis]MBM9616890.1 response regulator transcription factor [Desulfobulbus rhabdoformis]
MRITVMLVDDHTIMLEGLKSLLEQAEDIEVIAQATNGGEAVQQAEIHRPQVIVMDLTMPGMGGIEATRRIVTAHPDINVLALSMLKDKSCVVECLKAGAKGYLLKDCAGEELIGAIRALAAGEFHTCSMITELIIRDYIQLDGAGRASARQILSKREQEVLQLIADGKSTKEIAFQFGVSTKTIDVQRNSIMKKLNLFSVAELTKYAVREGLSSIEQ